MPHTETPASPVEALLAPEPRVAQHPAVRAAATITADVLAPHAHAADDPARGVDPAHLTLLAESGLLSVTMPAAEGGHGADGAVDAETVELISGACGATWLLCAQHRLPQHLSRGPLAGMEPGAVTLGPAAERFRAGLADASTSAGIVSAHLRRPGPPVVRAEPRAGGGWQLTGHADWCTGWGIVDVVMIVATSADGRHVLALLPAEERAGLRASGPLPLSVMAGTRTVALDLDGLEVGPEDVLTTIDADAWRVHDAARTTNAAPAALGLLRRVLVELHEVGRRRGQAEAVDTALTLAERAAHLRAEAYALLFGVPMFERLAQRTALRGQLAALAVRAANALVAARSGSAMLASSPEQRWVREAAFHLVQAQTAPVRAAQLAALAGAS